jgi:hypothetical protein
MTKPNKKTRRKKIIEPKDTELDIPAKKVKKYVKFLEEYKCACGLDNWELSLYTKYCTDMGTNLAHTDYNPLEKEAQISLSKELKEFDEKKVLNILLHELIHTRVGYMQAMTENVISLHEEMLVNDLTKGFELLTGFETK